MSDKLVYTAFYSLNELPFRLTPDPRYLFLSEKHKEALAHIMFCVRQGSGFAVITGEIGAGKTTLIRTFLRDAEPDIVSAYIFNPTLSDLELLQAVNEEFGLPIATSRKELVDRLNRFLLQQKRAGKTAVVIVDEAQALSPAALEQLRLLSNLETETEKLMQIILVGQPDLKRLLSRPELSQLKQRVSISWHLGRLNRSETEAYVGHRLNVAAGGGQQRILSSGARRLVYTYSRGVPRTINILCDRALLIGYTSNRQRIGARVVRRAVTELETQRLRLAGSLLKATSVSALVAALVVVLLLALPSVQPLEDAQAPGGALLEEKLTSQLTRELPTSSSIISVAAGPRIPPSERALPELLVPPAPAAAASDLEQHQAGNLAELGSLIDRLAKMTRQQSLAAATDQLLTLWRAPSLTSRERKQEALQLSAVAQRRGLDLLWVSGTWARLRLLNLPAVLELVLPDTNQRRLITMASLDEETARLLMEEKSSLVPISQLETAWHGDARVFWRDYEQLPYILKWGSSGPEVGRLKGLLAGLGIGRRLTGDTYDRVTAQAVSIFQREHRIKADGIVGPLTKILLYGSAGKYAAPRLRGEDG